MISEREKLEFESLPEFVREPRPTRESYVTASTPKPSAPVAKPFAPIAKPADPIVDEPSEPIVSLPKTAELEALWPGVSHDFLHMPPKRGASFYLCIGFAAGAIFSWAAVWAYSAISHAVANQPASKEIVVTQKQSPASRTESGGVPTAGSGEPDTILPLSPSYEVGSGDTLAGIALKNYHRATPRLLDEICRANNMSNANVLSLGQKLVLPEYHPQSRQIAVDGAHAVR